MSDTATVQLAECLLRSARVEEALAWLSPVIDRGDLSHTPALTRTVNMAIREYAAMGVADLARLTLWAQTCRDRRVHLSADTLEALACAALRDAATDVTARKGLTELVRALLLSVAVYRRRGGVVDQSGRGRRGHHRGETGRANPHPIIHTLTNTHNP